jgi:hypothetical protein
VDARYPIRPRPNTQHPTPPSTDTRPSSDISWRSANGDRPGAVVRPGIGPPPGTGVGGPSVAGSYVLPHQSGTAADRTTVWGVEVGGRPDRCSSRATVGVGARRAPTRFGHSVDRGWHAGAHPRSEHGGPIEELPLLDQPAGRHRRQHPAQVAVGEPLPGNRNDCVAYRQSLVDQQCQGAAAMSDGGCHGNPEVIMPCRQPVQRTGVEPDSGPFSVPLVAARCAVAAAVAAGGPAAVGRAAGTSRAATARCRRRAGGRLPGASGPLRLREG